MVVDHFSKMVYFVSCHKITNTSYIANLYFREIVHLDDTAKTITFDKEVKFISHFWRSYRVKLNTRVQFSLAPLKEMMNRSLGNLLRCFVVRISNAGT